MLPMPTPPAGDLVKAGAPTPKGPPASFTPIPSTVQEAQPMSSCAATARPGEDVQMAQASALTQMQQVFQGLETPKGQSMAKVSQTWGQKPRVQWVCSPSDIDWNYLFHDQLEPQFYGGPDPKTSKNDLRLLRNQVPKLDDKTFKDIFPGEDESVICVVKNNYSRRYVHLQEAATWILNATHWFNVLQQPMMIVIWCRDWNDASKFQYLLQILQVNFKDYIPKWQIL